ncbi:MAG TPA: META domain-containing protein [Steroidobacteraceae bacterium]
MNRMRVATIGAACLAVVGCSLVRPDSPKVDLRGAWVAEDIDGAGVTDNAQSTLEFMPGDRVAGRGGCNRYSGSVKLSGGSLLMSELFSTKMACAPALMDQETRYLAALQAVRSYRMEGTKLVLVDATGKPRLRFSRQPDG